MSAQARYSTLLKNTTAIYSSVAERRTELLHKGLSEIVEGVSPSSPGDWGKVRGDSAILLQIWATKEAQPAALEVQTQLLSFLEVQASSSQHLGNLPSPSLLISDAPVDKIRHVKAYVSDDEEEDEDEEEESRKVVVLKEAAAPAPAPAPAPKKVVEVVESEEEEEEEEEEEVEEEVEEEEVEEEEVEEEEVEEEVEEEEEADGMEVEQVVIRGRTYWIDTNSKKLYANAAGDEVGDEVGAMVNGKPVFLSK